MPITTALIDEAIARYRREHDRYRKLVDVVEQKVRQVKDYNAIRATVSGRAKTPESLRGKLLRFAERPEKQALINTIDDVFRLLGDLAAVRVSTYIDADRERMVNLLQSEFANGAGQRLGSATGDIEVKPPQDGSSSGKSSRFYRATHCMAYLQEPDLRGLNENLGGTVCEIQVCSLLAHVWNEIEHDLGYKPNGDLSAEELDCLAELAQKTQEGDRIIARLMSAAEEKLKVSDDPFKSPDDFYARLKDLVPMAAEPRQELNDLHYALVSYRMRSPRDVTSQLLTEGWEERGKELIARLNERQPEGEAMEPLKDHDILPVLFMARHGKALIEKHRKAKLPENRLYKLARWIQSLPP